MGSVRIPLAGPYHPQATLLRFPDGRLLWRIRLWEEDRAYPRLIGTATLLAFCRLNRLDRLRADVLELVAQAGRLDVHA